MQSAGLKKLFAKFLFSQFVWRETLLFFCFFYSPILSLQQSSSKAGISQRAFYQCTHSAPWKVTSIKFACCANFIEVCPGPWFISSMN
jgi:hypothetical protein